MSDDGSGQAEIISAIGSRIRSLRTERGLTLARFAESTGLSVSYLSAVEKGVNSPSLPVLARIANGLGLSISETVGDADGPVLPRYTPHSELVRGVNEVGREGLFLKPVVVRSGPGDAGPAPLEEGDPVFVYVTKGEIDLELDTKEVSLAVGDGLTSPRARIVGWKHRGRELAEAVWVTGVRPV